MLGILLRLIAFLLFVLAGCNQDLFGQPPADLISFGLASWVLATIFGGWSPPIAIARREG